MLLLIGFMAAGKTSVGRALAAATGRRFVDLDDAIAATGVVVAELVARDLRAFRELEAQTTMLVNDGETSVLGGIYTRNTGLAYKKVPFLADLPVIGWFSKSRRENDDRTEILVFITPKITNKARLHCGP